MSFKAIISFLKMEALNPISFFIFIFFKIGWIWLPFLLALLFFKSWMYYIQRFYWRNLDWVMLEVKPPKEIANTPKNMEQIFAGLWGAFGNFGTKHQKYFLGMLQDYFSFELAGLNGEIHFYLRVLRKYRDLAEAQFYSQYPQAEIREVEDYTERLPEDVPGKNWDLWGCRLKLDRDSVYPIRSYPLFMDITAKGQVFLDPLSGFMEVMAKLKYGEQIWIQMVFRPIADTWRDQARAMAGKLAGKPAAPKAEGLIGQDLRTWKESIMAVSHEVLFDKPAPDTVQPKPEDVPASKMLFLTPGERETVLAIEAKAGKKVCEVKIQWAYIARREIFSGANISAIMGLFNQFAFLSLNTFRPDPDTMTKAYYGFARTRKAYKQRVLLRLLRQRSFWEKWFVLNIEEMATVFHLPTAEVKAPATPFIEAKKGGAPLGLPVE